jgi:signal transduction histidine kinase
VVAFVLVTGLPPLFVSPSRSSVIAASVALVAVQAIALWWRRRHSLAVLAVIVLAVLPQFVIARDHEPAGSALGFAVYAVSVYDRGRMRLWVAGIAIAIIVSAVALLLLGEFQSARSLIPAGAISLVAWVIGDYIRSRRQFFLELVARHQQAREQAAEDERMRIARELHDVVAHNVSAMAIQAGSARVTGSSSPDALKSIEITARDTLSELNRLLGVLRKGPGAPELSPQPGLDQVDGLLKPARVAGIETTLKVTGERRALPAALDLSAYRIVQEAVTNVLKHAQASRVEVTIDYQPDSLILTISDNGSGSRDAAVASTGHGLIGMRERVELFNGELGATSSSLGGFTVRARLLLSPSGERDRERG